MTEPVAARLGERRREGAVNREQCRARDVRALLHERQREAIDGAAGFALTVAVYVTGRPVFVSTVAPPDTRSAVA